MFDEIPQVIVIPEVLETDLAIESSKIIEALPANFSQRGVKRAIENLISNRCLVVRGFGGELLITDPELGINYKVI
jgi:hypothetical protein